MIYMTDYDQRQMPSESQRAVPAAAMPTVRLTAARCRHRRASHPSMGGERPGTTRLVRYRRWCACMAVPE